MREPFGKRSRCKRHRRLDVETLPSIALEAARRLRSMGVNVSTAEALLAAEVAALYAAAGNGLDFDDLVYVFSSTMVKRSHDSVDLEQVLRSILCGDAGEPVEEVLTAAAMDARVLHASFGDPIRVPRSRMSREQLKAYARLKTLGFVRRGRRGEYIVGRKAGERIAAEIARLGGYAEAFRERITSSPRAAASAAAIMRGDVVDFIDFDRASSEALLSLYRFIRERGIREFIAHRLANRIDQDDVPSGREEDVFDTLYRHGLVTPERLEKLLSARPSLAGRAAKALGIEEVLDAAERLSASNPRLGAEVAARALGLGVSAAAALEEARRLGASYMEAVGRLEFYKRLAEASTAIDRFLETSDEAYLDYALYELDRARSEASDNTEASAVEAVEGVAKALREGNTYLVASLLDGRVDLYSKFEVLYRLFKASESRGDPRTRRIAYMLMSLLWRTAVLGIGGFSLSKRRVKSPQGERVEVRETVFKLARLRSEIVWSSRARLRRVVLLLDKSASMRRHAFYALAAAAGLAPLLRAVILFDEEVREIPARRLGRSPVQVAEKLLSTHFHGFTDIRLAVRYAVGRYPPQRMILVSDMRQTVKPLDSHVEALVDAARRGWKVFVIGPEGVKRYAKRLGSTCCIEVFEVRSPSEIGRVLRLVATRN